MRKIGLCVDDMIGLQELFSVLINFTDLNSFSKKREGYG